MRCIAIIILLALCSCQSILDKPKNLIPKKDMAMIIAELAMNDQANFINPSGNIEAGTRYILQQHKIKGKDFVDSYQYYILNSDIQSIYNDAQNIILDKDDKAKTYILEKIKQNKNIETQKQTLQ